MAIENATSKSALQKARDDDAEASLEKLPGNVYINVYDITPRINACLRRCCCTKQWGIYHSGVEVHGLEVSFGGHDHDCTGVFCARPQSANGASFYEQLLVGHISMDRLELRSTLAEVSGKWPGNSYDLFGRNCNDFTNAFCQDLVGQPAPSYINRCAQACFVRCVWNKCLLPFARCLERCRILTPMSITYDEDSDAVAGENTDQLGIEGAKGINQVLVEAATLKKNNANELFKSGAYEDAQTAYMKALSFLQQLSHRNEEEDEVVKQARTVRISLLLNIAACDLKLWRYENVVENCDQVLILEQGNVKAKYRKGVACSYMGRLQEAMAELRFVLQVTDASDTGTVRDIRREIDRVRQLMEGEKKEEKSMAKRMLGAAPIGRKEVLSTFA